MRRMSRAKDLPLIGIALHALCNLPQDLGFSVLKLLEFIALRVCHLNSLVSRPIPQTNGRQNTTKREPRLAGSSSVRHRSCSTARAQTGKVARHDEAG